MTLLLAICWEFDHQEEWVTWARLEGPLGCPYRRDVEADILRTTNYTPRLRIRESHFLTKIGVKSYPI